MLVGGEMSHDFILVFMTYYIQLDSLGKEKAAGKGKISNVGGTDQTHIYPSRDRIQASYIHADQEA